MSNISIGHVQTTRIQPQHQQLTSEQVQQRIALYTGDQLEKSKSGGAAAPSGQSLPMGVDPEGKVAFEQAMASASPEAQAQILEAGNQLAKGLAQAAGTMSPGDPIPPSLQKDIEFALGSTSSALKTGDSNEAVAAAAFASIDATNSELEALAHKVQSNLDEKGAITETINELRSEINILDEEIDGMDPDPSKMYTLDTLDENGNPTTLTMNKDDWEKHKAKLGTAIENLDDRRQQLTDMNQMDNLMLQDMMQKQQQMFQLLSNLSKSLHDTAKAIIQNAKA